MIDEKELLTRASHGDADAFEQLIAPYQVPVFRLALRMCGNEALAEEIAQDALISAWKGLPNFRGEAKFSSWLYRLTSNAAIDTMRREKRHQQQTDIEELQISDGIDTPQDALESDEKKQIIQHSINQLSPEHRAIILLRHMQDLSYEEIGEILNIPVGTVKSRLNRAKKELKDILVESGNIFVLNSVKTNREREGRFND